MRAIALIEEPDHVCYRYRLEAYIPELWQRGCLLEAHPLARRWLARASQLRATAAADVVILQRKLLPLWQIALLRRSARYLIYDFDDALFHRDSYATKGVASRQRVARFWATVSAADAVVAGNEFLAEQARKFVGTERVSVIPTSIRPEVYPLARHDPRDRRTRLVWIGQPSTLRGLELARPHLQAIAQRMPNVELRVVCSTFPSFGALRVVPRHWSQAGEADELANSDIGISWLPDDPWSQGKCGLKVLQYLAAGLPVIANPVGMHCQLVRPGETGFLAETPQQWAEAVATLSANPELRQRMGEAGRRLVEEEFNEHLSAVKFAGVVESLIGRDLPAAAREFVPLACHEVSRQPVMGRVAVLAGSREPAEW